jgi:hypothetical protein
MDYKILLIFIFLIIIVSIQYTLNRILIELKEIKKIVRLNKDK